MAATSYARVQAAFQFKEADRVPFFLFLTIHGAQEMGLPIREYFSRPEYVAEGQMRLRRKYRHDALYSFFYAALEFEAWGGEVVFRDDGPPNSGQPVIQRAEDILKLQPPNITHSPGLNRVLETIRLLHQEARGEAPVIGVVLSPFSLPVMQMGFDRYIDLIYERPKLFKHLMQINEAFCIEWANSQVKAGADLIVYFDPVSSSNIISRELYLHTGHAAARRIIPRFTAPLTAQFTSGSCLPILEDLAEAGFSAISASFTEDITALKTKANRRLALIGNLNGVEMRRWSPQKAEEEVKKLVASAAQGGGFILSDSHGEIPLQVSENTLLAIAEAVHRWGVYPVL